MVSSSEAVRYVDTLLHGGGQELQQVGGDKTFFAEGARADLAGQPVQVDRGRHRFTGAVGKLREQSGDESGEDVAAAAGAERGRPGGIDPDAAIGKCDHGAL